MKYLKFVPHVENLNPRLGFRESQDNERTIYQIKPVPIRPWHMPTTQYRKHFVSIHWHIIVLGFNIGVGNLRIAEVIPASSPIDPTIL